MKAASPTRRSLRLEYESVSKANDTSESDLRAIECQPSACTPIEHYCSESCMDTGLLGPLEQVQGIPSFIETVSIPALGVEADTLNAVPRGSTITEIVEFTHMQS